MLISKCCHTSTSAVACIVEMPENLVVRIAQVVSPGECPAGFDRALHNMPLEPTCPYSAVDLYRTRRDWISNFDIPEGATLDEVIERQLHDGPYGRCVFRCDNNVVDNQVVTMEMASGVTASLA